MPQFNWSPGIGDPSAMGWVTVFLYLMTAVDCWFLSRKLRRIPDISPGEIRIWLCLAIVFFALGINKQLDLQSALTEVGRVLAREQGWYELRKSIQIYCVIGIAVAGVFALALLARWSRGGSAAAWCALGGSIVLFTFILMRAASFHHFDQFIGQHMFGLRWNWILEIGGILIVLLASRQRHVTVHRSAGFTSIAQAYNPGQNGETSSARDAKR